MQTRLYLENENYQIIEAENGKQALELLKKEHVDLCLLDIMMPEMDGYHVLQELRKTSNIPVMILSAKDADSEKILGLNLGADDYLAKPFNPLEAVARVNTYRHFPSGSQMLLQIRLLLHNAESVAVAPVLSPIRASARFLTRWKVQVRFSHRLPALCPHA